MLQTKNQLVLTDQFMAHIMQGDHLAQLEKHYHGSLPGTPVVQLQVSDKERVLALHNTLQFNHEVCTYDAYSFVYHWLFTKRFDYMCIDQCVDDMVDYLVNANLTRLFMDSCNIFQPDMVKDITYELWELFKPNGQSI